MVVLVAHWFLAHTFFVTVLSIDLQRLEVLSTAPDSRSEHYAHFVARRTSPAGPRGRQERLGFSETIESGHRPESEGTSEQERHVVIGTPNELFSIHRP